MKNIEKAFDEFERRRLRKKIIILIHLVIVLLVIVGFLIILIQPKEKTKTKVIEEISNLTLEDCENLDLLNTSHCLVDYVNTFYKYRKVHDDVRLSLDELKKDGGDCLNYVRFYERELKKLGYNSIPIDIPIKKIDKSTYLHATLISYDITGYCYLNLNYINCYTYER